MGLILREWEDMELTEVAQNLAAMETAMNLRGSLQCGEYLISP